jgi:hypothetical protein
MIGKTDRPVHPSSLVCGVRGQQTRIVFDAGRGSTELAEVRTPDRLVSLGSGCPSGPCGLDRLSSWTARFVRLEGLAQSVSRESWGCLGGRPSLGRSRPFRSRRANDTDRTKLVDGELSRPARVNPQLTEAWQTVEYRLNRNELSGVPTARIRRENNGHNEGHNRLFTSCKASVVTRARMAGRLAFRHSAKSRMSPFSLQSVTYRSIFGVLGKRLNSPVLDRSR